MRYCLPLLIYSILVGLISSAVFEIKDLKAYWRIIRIQHVNRLIPKVKPVQKTQYDPFFNYPPSDYLKYQKQPLTDTEKKAINDVNKKFNRNIKYFVKQTQLNIIDMQSTIFKCVKRVFEAVVNFVMKFVKMFSFNNIQVKFKHK